MLVVVGHEQPVAVRLFDEAQAVPTARSLRIRHRQVVVADPALCVEVEASIQVLLQAGVVALLCYELVAQLKEALAGSIAAHDRDEAIDLDQTGQVVVSPSGAHRTAVAQAPAPVGPRQLEGDPAGNTHIRRRRDQVTV